MDEISGVDFLETVLETVCLHLNHFYLFKNKQNAVESVFLGYPFLIGLFPLNSRWWFTRNIVHDTVNVVDFINDSDRDFL